MRKDCGLERSSAELAADLKVLRARGSSELIGRCRRALADEVRPTKRLRGKSHPEDL